MTSNKKLLAWVEEWVALCQPASVYWVDGSAEENQRLMDEMVASGMATKLNEEKQPGSYAFNSDPVITSYSIHYTKLYEPPFRP